MNTVDFVILGILGVIIFLAVRKIVMNKKSGKCNCGCSCGCSDCNICKSQNGEKI